MEELTAKLGQQTSQEHKEGNNSDGSGKEEDASNSLPGSTQVLSHKLLSKDDQFLYSYNSANFRNFSMRQCLKYFYDFIL